MFSNNPKPKTPEEIFQEIEHALKGMWSNDLEYDDVPKAPGVLNEKVNLERS